MAERVGFVPSVVSESEPREAKTRPEPPTTEPKVRELAERLGFEPCKLQYNL